MTATTSEKLLWDDPNFSRQSNSVDTVTGVYARHMLIQADLTSSSKAGPLRILDNACGNGILTYEIQQLLKDQPQETIQITCGDLADAMLEAAAERIRKEGWNNVKVVKVDAQDTKLASGHFTHVLTNFAMMLVPRPDDMLNECYRILERDGTCAFTTWQEVGWLDDIRSAMADIPNLPSIPSTADELATSFGVGAWNNARFIKDTMLKHNFVNVEVKSIANTSVMTAEEDIKRLVRVCTSILTKKFWTEEQRARYDNESLLAGVEKWLWNKYRGNPIRWHWVALVTTGKKC